MEIAPPFPHVAVPVAMDISPLEPIEAVPVLMERTPDTPEVPASAEDIETLPLLVDEPDPDDTDRLPPVDMVPTPPFSVNNPPCPQLP